MVSSTSKNKTRPDRPIRACFKCGKADKQKLVDCRVCRELFHLKCSQFDSINNDYICVGCGPLRIEPPADDDDICPVCDGVCNCKNGFTAEAPYALGFTLDPISPLKRKRNPSRRVAVVKNTRPPPKRDVKRCGKTHLPPVGINSIYDSDDSFSDLFGDDYERKDLHHSEVDSDFMDADDLETLFRIDDDRLLDGYNDLEDDDSDNDPMGEDELVEQLVYTGWSSDDESDGGSDMAFLFDTFQTPATSEVSVSDDDDDELKATNLFELKAPSEKTADTESLLDGQEVSDFEENYDSDIFDPKSSKEVASIDPKLIHSPFVSPAFSYDVKKDQVGPNGEIISTTKTMKFKVRPKKLVKIDTKAKKTPILPPKKLTHLTAPLPKGFKPQSSKTAPTASTTLAIQAAAASILKSCGLPITTSNTGENTAYASLASINPFAAAMAMMAATNPQMFLAISEYRGKAPEQQAIKEEVLDIDELVNHDDEPVTSENPFSSTSDDVYRWDKVPSWVFRKSRKVSQKRRDLSRAVRIGRNAHKVLGGGRYDLNERKRTRITKENEIKSPKFTNFMTYSPIFGSNGGLYADCPELNLGDSLMSPERKKRVSRR